MSYFSWFHMKRCQRCHVSWWLHYFSSRPVSSFPTSSYVVWRARWIFCRKVGEKKKEKEKKIGKKNNICYKFISWEITQARMDLNFSEPLCNPVGQNICESSSAGGAPLNNLIKRLWFRQRLLLVQLPECFSFGLRAEEKDPPAHPRLRTGLLSRKVSFN